MALFYSLKIKLKGFEIIIFIKKSRLFCNRFQLYVKRRPICKWKRSRVHIFRQQMLNDSILESFGKSEERTTYFTYGIIFISFEIKAIFSESLILYLMYIRDPMNLWTCSFPFANKEEKLKVGCLTAVIFFSPSIPLSVCVYNYSLKWHF